MTEYWIPMILDFNQSLNIDTLEKKQKKAYCNWSVSLVFDSFTAADIIVNLNYNTRQNHNIPPFES